MAGTLDAVAKDIEEAQRKQSRDPLVAAGEYLTAADLAQRQLARNPADTAARDAYNFAVARVMSIIQDEKLDPWSKPLRVPAAGGDFILMRKPDPRPQWHPALYDFTPADQFTLKGSYVSERKQKTGVGAPTVATGRDMNKNFAKDLGIPRTYYGVTVVIHFDGRRAVVGFEDPLTTENVSLGGRSFPLAADYTVPLAVMLASTKPEKLELSRLLRPAKYAETARISRLQPYDPDKTVVLVVHGLMDSPATWTPMINLLRSDSAIRKNYQFWFYSYPTGYPYPHSAAILREKLDAAENRFPLRKKMVVVGHSMGGCISRLLMTDTGEKLWMDVFNKRPDQVPLSPENKKLIADALIFQHRPELGRVIFVAAPLRGSDLATNWLGRIGSTLVKSPAKLLGAGADAMKFAVTDSGGLKLNRMPNSVDTLSPKHRFVKLINTLPLAPGIPYHVICGDRGKGGNKGQTPPVMSDGFVPYWSSRLDGAESELIVPSAHSVHQNPQAIREVMRILKQHLPH
jgi:pimeloyl-ACP methyl ester carboxylesterase